MTKGQKGKEPVQGLPRTAKERDGFFANVRNKGITDRAAERAASIRAPSIVRDHRKEREKPYRTEFKKAGTAKKKKINYRSTYQQAPRGYIFLPLGTNDLAERCKELSRQRNFPVQVVDAEPRSRQARDPEKVSHYVHRIGYHFRTEVVEQAVEELGYVLYRGRYIKEDDLRNQNQKSFLADVLKRHGIRMDEPAQQETPEQVRAAIMELFPKIPEFDLNEIVQHAWMEGTGRVGTQEHLDLPRRVQLATIARIRHNYTDYDRLLPAFGWLDARAEVEPVSLQKLLEWRGEDQIEDDNAFEEIVRETIVIPDNSSGDEESGGSEADDEETDVENGHPRVQYTHRIAEAEDLRPESAHELPYFLQSDARRYGRDPRWWDYANNVIRRKLEEARETRRTGNVTNVFIPPSGSANAPREVEFDGETFIRASESPPPPPPPMPGSARDLSVPPPPPLEPLPSFATYQQHHQQQTAMYRIQHPMQQVQPFPFTITPNQAPQYYEVVRPSIEHDTPSTHHSAANRQVTPARSSMTLDHVRRDDVNYHRSHMTPPRPTQVIDLTTPERRNRSENPSPMRDVQRDPKQYAEVRYYTQPGANVMYERLPVLQTQALDPLRSSYYQQPQQPMEAEPYDPRQPLLRFPDRDQQQQSTQIIHQQQLPPWVQRNEDWIPPRELDGAHNRMPMPQYNVVYPPNNGGQPVYQQVVYQEQQPMRYFVSGSGHTPQPIHGAPAPVQQMPLDGRR